MEMEASIMKIVLLIFLSLTFNAHAAIKKNKDDLATVRSEALEFGARLATLEKELGSKNNLYLSSVQQITQFETDIKIYREKLQELHQQVTRTRAENKRIVQSYLTNADDDGLESWQKNVHLQLLKQAQTKLMAREAELISYENKVAEFDQKLGELKLTEQELAKVIQDLELRKKSAMEIYMAKVEAKNKSEKKSQKMLLAKKIKAIKKSFSETAKVAKRPDRFFKRPMDEFVTYTSSEKGITFKYKSVQPVRAAGEGKVVFAGDLASYGQVVLIDHGQDLRTVILGKMDIKVKKNDRVNDGDILAYTQSDLKEAQNLYFEVRKKNTAQNTILWLEPSGVSKI